MNSNRPETLNRVFTKNRTEELGYDVWRHFVIPPFYDDLDLQQARKPRVIIGGRGCGKTMLLRYLSYHSTFSSSRSIIPSEALRHIGLYWRADTQFAKLMTGRNIQDYEWNSAFNHLLALVVSSELLDSLVQICKRDLMSISETQLSTCRFRGLEAYGADFETDFSGLKVALENKLHQFEVWVSNVGKVPEPIFLPGRNFVSTLVSECKKQIPSPDYSGPS